MEGTAPGMISSVRLNQVRPMATCQPSQGGGERRRA